MPRIWKFHRLGIHTQSLSILSQKWKCTELQKMIPASYEIQKSWGVMSYADLFELLFLY